VNERDEAERRKFVCVVYEKWREKMQGERREKKVGSDRRPMATEERSEERITQGSGGRREPQRRETPETGRSACATRN
jgi:hypothetical protein